MATWTSTSVPSGLTIRNSSGPIHSTCTSPNAVLPDVKVPAVGGSGTPSLLLMALPASEAGSTHTVVWVR